MRVIDMRIVPRAEDVARARRAFDALAGTLEPPALEDARLLATELVSNCVQHGLLDEEQRIILQVELRGSVLHVEVRDEGRGLPPFTHPATQISSGWGFVLVDRLAERWGVSSRNPTTVWFEIFLEGGGDRSGTVIGVGV